MGLSSRIYRNYFQFNLYSPTFRNLPDYKLDQIYTLRTDKVFRPKSFSESASNRKDDVNAKISNSFGLSLRYFSEPDSKKIYTLHRRDWSKCTRKRPVITILGHVDHGKTTMLDFIRKSSLAKHEMGGITQRIGAFYAYINAEHQVVFLDTPGHYLFSSMRSKTAGVADMAILVIAWEDGIMPQTKESIKLLLKEEVPFIVAVNKCDRHIPQLNKVSLISNLSSHGVYTEEDGGHVPVVYVSALTGKGMVDLANTIIALEEVSDFRADFTGPAEGVVIETFTSTNQGSCATIVVKRGTLKCGDLVVCDDTYCRIRKIITADGVSRRSAVPSDVAQVFGWKSLPPSGHVFICSPSDYDERRLRKIKEANQAALITSDTQILAKPRNPKYSGSKKFRWNKRSRIRQEVDKTPILNSTPIHAIKNPTISIIINADSHGSIEAIKKAINSLDSHDCKIEILDAKVGDLKESDLVKYRTSDSKLSASQQRISQKSQNIHMLLFNVETSDVLLKVAVEYGITIKTFFVVYDLLDYLKESVSEVTTPIKKVELSGVAEIIKIFSIYSLKRNNIICGSRVTSGTIYTGSDIELYRSSQLLYKGNILSIKILNKDTNSVSKGHECGIIIEGISDFNEGDVIKVYKTVEYKPNVRFNEEKND